MPPDTLAGFDDWLGSAARSLGPAPRKAMMREIVRELRKRNQKRITAQEGPDGEAWTPRKRATDGRVRSTAKLLVGFRAARRMRASADAEGGTVGFTGRTAAIASVHQFGEVDEVAAGGPRIAYPARPLLGLSATDEAWVRSLLIERIGDALT